MNAGRRTVYSRHTLGLLSYRRSANVLKYTQAYIERLADRGLLCCVYTGWSVLTPVLRPVVTPVAKCIRYFTLPWVTRALALVRAWLPSCHALPLM